MQCRCEWHATGSGVVQWGLITCTCRRDWQYAMPHARARPDIFFCLFCGGCQMATTVSYSILKQTPCMRVPALLSCPLPRSPPPLPALAVPPLSGHALSINRTAGTAAGGKARTRHIAPAPAPCHSTCATVRANPAQFAGDNAATANAVARQVGILGADVSVPGFAAPGGGGGGGVVSSAAFGARVSADGSPEVHAAECMTAADFLHLSDQEQRVAALRLRVLARVEPLHKQKLVELLQEAGEVRHQPLPIFLHTPVDRTAAPCGCTGAVASCRGFAAWMDVVPEAK